MTQHCPIEHTMKFISGKWKLILLWHLTQAEALRYGQIKRSLPEISHKMLSQQLKELEADGFVHRRVYPEIPPKVEYSLTDRGRSFIPVLESLSQWGETQLASKEE